MKKLLLLLALTACGPARWEEIHRPDNQVPVATPVPIPAPPAIIPQPTPTPTATPIAPTPTPSPTPAESECHVTNRFKTWLQAQHMEVIDTATGCYVYDRPGCKRYQIDPKLSDETLMLCVNEWLARTGHETVDALNPERVGDGLPDIDEDEGHECKFGHYEGDEYERCEICGEQGEPAAQEERD